MSASIPTSPPSGRASQSVLAVGASHRTAAAAALGELTVAAEVLKRRFRAGDPGIADLPVRELVTLTTCNRVEVFAAVEAEMADDAVRAIHGEVFDSASGNGRYELRGIPAVRHLCRVAAGLDSVVLGEHQIAGQVARAFADVAVRGEDARVLEDAGAAARTAVRRVRTETKLGRYPASVSSVSVDIARRKLGDLGGLTALVVGAGKAGLLVSKALKTSGVGRLVVVNRSAERAAEVAERVSGDAAPLSALSELLASADLVISATGAEGVLVDVSQARAAVARRGARSVPLVIVDLALPRDVDTAVGRLEGVELLTLDDVEALADRHLSLRRDEVGPAEAVVEEVVREYGREKERPDMESFIAEMRRDIEELRSFEVRRWLERRESGAPPSREELDQLTRSIINKLLHEPMMRLRSGPRNNGHAALDLGGLVAVEGDTASAASPGE